MNGKYFKEKCLVELWILNGFLKIVNIGLILAIDVAMNVIKVIKNVKIIVSMFL